MKNLFEKLNETFNNINEARTVKPSGLSKFKTQKDTKDINVIVGDIYDLSGNNTVKQQFDYYRGDGDGFIMSKSGQVFDISVKEWSDDAGRIAGGSMNWSVEIYRVDGTNNLYLSGYSAIFSHPSSKTAGGLIPDIKAGYYLEDYIVKHWNDLGSNSKKIAEPLKELGNENAISYDAQKSNRKKEKIEAFKERYVECLTKGYKDDTIFAAIKIENGDIVATDYWSRQMNKVKDLFDATIKPLITDLIKKTFGHDDLNDLNGLNINVAVTSTSRSEKEFNKLIDWHVTKRTKNNVSSSNGCKICLDSKTGKLCLVRFEDNKVFDDVLAFKIGNELNIKYKDVIGASDYLKKLFSKLSKAWSKSDHKEKKSEYIQNAYDAAVEYEHNQHPLSYKKVNKHPNKEEREMYSNQYDSYIKDHTFDEEWVKKITDDNYYNSDRNKNKRYEFTTDLLDEVLKSFNKSAKVNVPKAEVPDNMDVSNAPKQSELVEKPKPAKDAEPTQHMIDRIDKWMKNPIKNGLNFKATGTPKLTLYYKLCVNKNFKHGESLVGDELKKRGVDLNTLQIKESLIRLSLKDFLKR